MDREIFVPAAQGRAFTVKNGQIFRIAQVEEKQVADVIFLNANDYKETFNAGHTTWLNCIEKTGTVKKVTKLYSKPPRENVMATVVDDPVGINFAYMGTKCSRLIYRLRDKVDAPPHRTCQDNLTEAIAPYGLGPDDVPDVFNIWMNVDIGEDGRYIIKPPTVGPNDYIDIRAEMDLLVGVSACPQDIAPVNEYRIKPLKVIIRSIISRNTRVASRTCCILTCCSSVCWLTNVHKINDQHVVARSIEGHHKMVLALLTVRDIRLNGERITCMYLHICT